MPDVLIVYTSKTSSGLFAQALPGYGENKNEKRRKKHKSRATTEENVLESIYSLAGIAPASESSEHVFRGHPLAHYPTGAGFVFYGLWPGLILTVWLLLLRRMQ